VATVDLPLPYDESDPRAQVSIDLLRESLIPDAHLGIPDGVEIGVTGAVATSSDFVSQMSSRLPYVIGFVLAAALARKLKQLEARMHEHAKNLEFEEAAALRDQLTEIKHLAFVS
jgi:excinuclease UvrABC helicase subunit UvrB